MKKFIVRVDPDLCDLIPGFLEHKHDDARAILRAVSAERIDFEALRGIGHKLKGEGGSYGFDAISLYGAEIERAARNRDTEMVRRYANELVAYLKSVQIQFE